jgi:hypothetical protein
MEMTNFYSAFKLMVGIKKIKNDLCLKATVIKEKHSKLDKKHYNGHMNKEIIGSNVIKHLLLLPCAMNKVGLSLFRGLFPGLVA